MGKTTTSINLAASLKATRKNVLLVDLDPQGNATTGSGVAKEEMENTVYELITGRCSFAEAMVHADNAEYDLLPANGDLTAAEVELMQAIGRELKLRKILEGVRDNYDYIIIGLSTIIEYVDGECPGGR